MTKVSFFFFNDTATTEIYTLSLHDALPISIDHLKIGGLAPQMASAKIIARIAFLYLDRKSTRLNSSHQIISYAVFCLKKKHINSLTAPDADSNPRSFNTSTIRSQTRTQSVF